MQAIIEQARLLAGYESSSELLQRRDQDWVLDRAQIAPQSMLDLGCGIGSLLHGAMARWPDLTTLWGIEQSALRVLTAGEKMAQSSAEVVLQQGDLLALTALAQRFDLISMTAVLHWLYPHEEQVLQWVGQHLNAQGVFLFTSHHPHNVRGLAGEDELVAQALIDMQISGAHQVPEHFHQAQVLPMGSRTRPQAALEAMVLRHFKLSSIASRSATLQVDSAEQYQRFHAATFGTYFSALVPEVRLPEFFARLGDIAMQRMVRQGYVTDIVVNVWRCLPRAPGLGA